MSALQTVRLQKQLGTAEAGTVSLQTQVQQLKKQLAEAEKLVRRPSCPRACYAMSGTEIWHGVICLRACYAVSGSELAYQPTRAIAGTSA
eukprot:3941821-Rhodomonas_salina.3